jgi:hypothetical protein
MKKQYGFWRGLTRLLFGQRQRNMVYFCMNELCVANLVMLNLYNERKEHGEVSQSAMTAEKTTSRYGSRDFPTLPADDLPPLAGALQAWISEIEKVDKHFFRIAQYYVTETGIPYNTWNRMFRGNGVPSREVCVKLAAYCRQKVIKSQQIHRGHLPLDDTPNLADLEVVLELAGYDTYASLLKLAMMTYEAEATYIRLLRDLAGQAVWKTSQQIEKAEADKILAGRRPTLDKIPLITRQMLLWLSNPDAEMPAKERRAMLDSLVR